MSIDRHDPRLTSYALGELDPREAAILEAELGESPDGQRRSPRFARRANCCAALTAEPAPTLRPSARGEIIAAAEAAHSQPVTANEHVGAAAAPRRPNRRVRTRTRLVVATSRRRGRLGRAAAGNGRPLDAGGSFRTRSGTTASCHARWDCFDGHDPTRQLHHRSQRSIAGRPCVVAACAADRGLVGYCSVRHATIKHARTGRAELPSRRSQ